MTMLPLEQSSNGWLQYSPSSSIFSAMQLKDSLPVEKSPCCNDQWTPNQATRLATACHTSSKQLQAELSLSDCSDPGLVEDPVGIWDSDSSLGDDQDYPSDYQGLGSDIWNSYGAPANDFSLSGRPFYRGDPTITRARRVQDPSFSLTTRK